MESQEPLPIDHDAKVAEAARHRAPKWTARERAGMMLTTVKILRKASPGLFRALVIAVSFCLANILVTLGLSIALVLK